MKLTTGQLNRRVTFITRSTERDAAGGQVDTWIDGETAWANIKPLYQAKTWQTSVMVAKATYQVAIRWRQSLRISDSDRIRFTDPSTNVVTTYEIEAIVPLDADRPHDFIALLTYVLAGKE